MAVGANYYPETMAHTFIINAPTVFSGAWSIIKGWLDERTRVKINVMGSKYHEKVFKVVDPEMLPTWLGGKCEFSFVQAEEHAIWNKYELVDGPGFSRNQIGVKHKSSGKLFTPAMQL